MTSIAHRNVTHSLTLVVDASASNGDNRNYSVSGQWLSHTRALETQGFNKVPVSFEKLRTIVSDQELLKVYKSDVRLNRFCPKVRKRRPWKEGRSIPRSSSSPTAGTTTYITHAAHRLHTTDTTYN